MPTLLTLPPELLIKIFSTLLDPTKIVDPLHVLPLTLIHPSLTPLAHQYLYLDLRLQQDQQVQSLVNFEAFKRHAGTVRSVVFEPSKGRGIGDGGIGTEETIQGKLAEQLLECIERNFEGSGVNGGGKLEELDIVGCSGMSILSLCGKSLASEYRAKTLIEAPLTHPIDIDLKRLSIGSALTSHEGSSYKFRLDSLTLVNNHWQSLSNPIIEQLCKETCQAQGTFTGLKILDLSNLYSIQSFMPLLHEVPGLFPSIEELYLPPFETLDQVLASTLLFEQNTADSPLRYLELPNLSDPRANLFMMPFLHTLSTNVKSALEIGFKNSPGQTLLDTILIVFRCLYGGPPGSSQADASGCSLRRVRMLKLRGTAEVSQTMEREGELVVDLIGQFGCEVEYGEFQRHRA